MWFLHTGRHQKPPPYSKYLKCLGKISHILQMLLPISHHEILTFDEVERKYNICKNKELTKGYFTFISVLFLAVSV